MFGAAFRDKNRRKVVYLADKRRRSKASRYAKRTRLAKHTKAQS